MNKQLEIVNALMDLSLASEKVARLLSQGALDDFKSDLPLFTIGNSTETVDLALYQAWPPINNNDPKFDVNLDDLAILEWVGDGQSVAISSHNAKSIDIITNNYPSQEQPKNVKIINESDLKARYDIGIMWETAEFIKDPAIAILKMSKYCRNIHIRFRPWSSQDGAFLAKVMNKAFAHLVMDVDHNVQHKVIRPLATYDAMFANNKLTWHERRINNIQLDKFFTSHPEILRVICERTWGTIEREQAAKIMATNSVDYVIRCHI